MEHEPPWKVVRCFTDETGAALVHLHNVSGGILGGDRLNISVDAGPSCEVQLTTTGSTRIYKAKNDRAAAHQQLHATVRQSALLELLPDAVIPYRGSRYLQSSSFELGANAGLFAWEIVAPGRAGERFALDELGMETEIFVRDTPIAVDAWRMQPNLRSIAKTIRLGAMAHQATLYVCRTGMPQEAWRGWENLMGEMIGAIDSSKQIWGVSTLPQDGLVFRGLAQEGLYLCESLIRFWRRMKVELYGREPVLPRKMF